MTDRAGSAILEEVSSSYETRERQALLNEAIQLPLHLGAGKPTEVQDNILSLSPWPNVVSRTSGRAKEAVSTVSSPTDLAKLDPAHRHPS